MTQIEAGRDAARWSLQDLEFFGLLEECSPGVVDGVCGAHEQPSDGNAG
jgi:hypothetical protein